MIHVFLDRLRFPAIPGGVPLFFVEPHPLLAPSDGCIKDVTRPQQGQQRPQRGQQPPQPPFPVLCCCLSSCTFSAASDSLPSMIGSENFWMHRASVLKPEAGSYILVYPAHLPYIGLVRGPIKLFARGAKKISGGVCKQKNM